jgi:hypothetical protein
MTYNVLAVCQNGEENYPLFPTLNDDLLVMGEELDGGFGETIQVSKVIVRRKVGNSYKNVTETNDISFQVWVTASRVIFYCKKFEKGGGWMGWGVGGLAVAIVANSVSAAMAASRRKGKALVGNIRYPWVSSVMFAPRNGMGTENQVRIAYVDGTDDSRPECDVTFHIERHRDANRLARHIADRVIAYRYASGEEMEPEELAGFEALRTSGLAAIPAKGYLSSYKMPTSWRVPIGMTKVPDAVPAFPPSAPGAVVVPVAAVAAPAEPVAQEEPPEVAAEISIPLTAAPDGSPLVSRSAFCESCGSPELGDNFCTDCGAPVDLEHGRVG